MNDDFNRLRGPDSGNSEADGSDWLDDLLRPSDLPSSPLSAADTDRQIYDDDGPLAWLRDQESSTPDTAETSAEPTLDWLQQYAAPVQTSSQQDEEELPDWIKDEAGATAPATPLAEPADDDWFGGLDEALGLAPSMEGAQGSIESGSSDWFAEPQVQPGTLEWLDQLGPTPPAETAANAASILLDDDLFPELQESQPKSERADRAASFPDFDTFDTPGLQDIDALLARYESTQASLPDTSDRLLDPNPDIDRLLSDEDLDQIGAMHSDTTRDLPPMSPDAPAWLAEISSSVGSVGEESAAAIVRKNVQTERPLEQLSDRLRALHKAGLDLPAEQEAPPGEALKSLLPGISELIPPTLVKPGIPGISGELILSPDQQEQARILRTLVALDEKRPSRLPSAIDLTLASSNLKDFAEPEFGEVLATAEPRTTGRVRRSIRIPVIRLLISVLISLAVILPFVYGPLRIGELPPASFSAGSRQQRVFDRLNALAPGQYVLIAAEYGTGGAAELDTALDAIARHVLARGARPVLVSGNPIGLLHARNVLSNISADTAFAAALGREDQLLHTNQDYFVTRYLIGEILGLRILSQDLPALIQTDISGTNTNLPIDALNDFSAIVVIAEHGEDIRAWAEQVAPTTSAPLLAVASYAAAPLVEPYLLSGSPIIVTGMKGLLVGLGDAYTYRAMLENVLSTGAFQSIARPLQITFPEATAELLPTDATVTPEPQTIMATPAPVTPAPAEPVNPTTEPVNAQPVSPTAEPPTIEPTVLISTPAPTAIASQPAQPAVPAIQAVIRADQAINVRSGPARTFAPIDVVEPGTTVAIIGRNAAGDWVQIRLEDGREGWVSAALLRIEAPAVSTPTPAGGAQRLPPDVQWVSLLSDSVPPFKAQIETTPEPAEQPGAAPTEAISEVVATSPVHLADNSVNMASTLAYREERWYGMTLGLVVIILLVALGALVNILRNLLRGGRTYEQ